MMLHVKNMVCDRCKMVVAAELEKLGLRPVHIELGEVEIAPGKLSASEREAVKNALEKAGFGLLEDRKTRLTGKIKALIIQQVHHEAVPSKMKLSEFLSGELKQDYSSLSALFSEVEGITVEQFHILQKIEKAKEYLSYGELTLSEIAFRMGYSSVAHLSNQFKKTTGLTPTQFRSAKERTALDDVGTKK